MTVIDNNDIDEEDFNEDFICDDQCGWVEVDNSRELLSGMSKNQIIQFFDNQVYKAL